MTSPPSRGRLDEFAAELEATFTEELRDRLRSMEASLVLVERPPDGESRREAIAALGRDAHSLKGGAQLVGRDAIARIAHALEASLEEIRTSDVDEVPLEALFRAVDALDRLGREGENAGPDVESIVRALAGEGGDGGRGPAMGTPHPAGPSPTEGRGPTEAGRGDPPSARADGSLPDDPPAVPASLDRAGPPPAAPTPPGRDAAPTERSGTRTVRVATERLDSLMARTADLIAARDAAARRASVLRQASRRRPGDRVRPGTRSGDLAAALAETRAELDAMTHQLAAAADEARRESQRLDLLIEGMEADLLALRMVPLEMLFREFPRMVRDLARASGKEVRLEGVGWDTPMDRDLLERLRDPVMHLLRNAVDHGIEQPEARRSAGKPAAGRIVLEARSRAGGIVIEVRDDGAGIDLARVRDRAAEAGLVAADAPASTALTLGLIFEAGLSTAARVTHVSGRGIGLDVVRAQVADIGGSVDVDSEPGRGTRFLLRLPLTLVSTQVLVVRAAGQRYGIPLAAVERAVTANAAEWTVLGDAMAIEVPGGAVVLSALEATLGTSMTSPADATMGDVDPRLGTVLVLDSAAGRAGIVVDAVETRRDIVLRGLGGVLGSRPLFAGAAIVDDDGLLLILDPDALVEATVASSAPWRDAPATPRRRSGASSIPEDRPVRVLVVDDSITTRTLEKNILAAAGFEVALAVDGRDALRSIRAQRPDIVVSDVDMPGLDGIALTREVRANEQTRELPIVLVTSLDAPEERDRGLDAGADAYLTKQTFDQQELLLTIRELVG